MGLSYDASRSRVEGVGREREESERGREKRTRFCSFRTIVSRPFYAWPGTFEAVSSSWRTSRVFNESEPVDVRFPPSLSDGSHSLPAPSELNKLEGSVFDDQALFPRLINVYDESSDWERRRRKRR